MLLIVGQEKSQDLLVIKATQELGNDYAVKLQQRTMKAWEPLQAPLVPP